MTDSDPVHLDRAHVWHPFTPHTTWFNPSFDPVVITSGQGSWLTDSNGKRYLDGNSSIWTNLHGHCHPHINAAIKEQLDQIAHSSFLGLTNACAPRLAARLVAAARSPSSQGPHLNRCFFSDDGSTAIEAALKIATQYFQQNGAPERTEFLSLGSAYHGDTIGAMSLSKSPQFHRPFNHLLFPGQTLPPPACYRCPFNRAQPVRGSDARLTRQCQWECLHPVQEAVTRAGPRLAGMIVEPLVQGAAGFLMHPRGYLEKAAALVQEQGGLFIVDEVMTGFFRTGRWFAHHHEPVQPDLVALAKGLTAGYLPMAATLCSEKLFQGFSGGVDRTFFHGHSYTGNQLGCRAALANLDLLEAPDFLTQWTAIHESLQTVAQTFWTLPEVGDVRQEGTILAIELVRDFKSRTPFDPAARLGARICEQARHHGLLTRPVGDVLLLMPPYSTTPEEVTQMGKALLQATRETLAAD
jgi:adenosylmethionine-8-amino-7-oxononanoate aminotransferase